MTSTIKYDATRRLRRGRLRGPDLNGWYNQPVALALTGSDAISGVASCGGDYAGPDGASRRLPAPAPMWLGMSVLR